jgi:transposase-like protein
MKCPECGSEKVVKHGWKILRTGKSQQYRCNDCANIWYEKPDKAKGAYYAV